LSELTLQVQAAIIVNVSVGQGYSNTTIPYEQENGSLKQMPISDSITTLFADTIKRVYQVHHLINPSLIKYAYMPSDWRYDRNVKSFRTVI